MKSYDYLSTRRRIRELAAMAPQGEIARELYDRAVEDDMIETEEPNLFLPDLDACIDAFEEGE